MEKQWYESWFDSPYYHILYKKHDQSEAQEFIDKLLNYLQPTEKAIMLDLACGKGRFSRYLADKGYEVTGLDLSENSIEYARQFETDNLSFYTLDMRKPFRVNFYDFVFSFFTSFGYFEREKDDLDSLKSVAKGLKKKGVYVLDFFNSNFVEANLFPNETKVIDGINFNIKREVKGKHVYKIINFIVGEKVYRFEERVRLFRLDDFERLIKKAGMEIIATFGDYYLSDFDHNKSPRLILIINKA